MTEDAIADHPVAATEAVPASGNALSATYTNDGTNLTISFPISAVLCLPNSPAVFGHGLPEASVTMDRKTLTISAPLARLRVKPSTVVPGAPVLKTKPAA